MKQFLFRLLSVINVGRAAWANQQTMANFKVVCQLTIMIMKVAKERRPMMMHIGFVHPDVDLSGEVVSIWAGAGMTSDPTKRITELLEENRLLKNQISHLINKSEL